MSKCDPSSLSTAPEPSALQQKIYPRRVAPEDLRSEAAWIEFRDSALEPLERSELVTTEQTRAEFIEGCRLLGLTFVFAHQLLIADMLNAGQRINGALLPRQVGKTKTLTIIALGRCALRTKYNAAMTVTTQAGKAHEIFNSEVIDELEAVWPDEDTRPFRLFRAAGRAHVAFTNGSRFSVKSPKGAAFRGSSYHFVWLDEGGEAKAETGVDLLNAILPAFMATANLADTPPQLIVTGTAGTFRKGQLLWDALKAPNGYVRYAFPDTVTGEDLESWDTAAELVRAMHPGLSAGLALESDLRDYFELDSVSAEAFAREIGGIFGTDLVGDPIITPEDWEAAALEIDPAAVTPPARLALAFGMDRDGRHASVVLAWRDEDGRAHLVSRKHRDGTDWVAQFVWDFCQRHPRTPVAYDTVNPFARSEADKLERAKPRVKLHPQNTREVATAAALLVDDAANGRIRHYRQPALDEAVTKAVKRGFRQSMNWGIGPSHPEDDVSALEAAALALRLYDTGTKAKQNIRYTMSA